jgi:DNA-binding NarL/FixJ family response regulator
MGKISIGIFDEHKIAQEGLSFLLKDIEDIEVVLKVTDKPALNESLKSAVVHVLIMNIHDVSIQTFNLISQLTILHPKIKILVLSVLNDENFVLKVIKAGAKGFLAKDTERNELIEAIYTLRNGHDYFSKSITHLLLNKYISNLKSEDGLNVASIKNLSSREVEILKLWGNSFSNQEIADKLFISVRTVESHKNHIMQKLNLKTIVDLVKFAIKNNLIEI